MYDLVEWNEFLRRFKWRPGEHLTAIAPTGAGKTTLLFKLLPYRKYSIFFGTKPDDPLYRQIIRSGFRRVESFDEIRPWENKIMLWPHSKRTIPQTLLAQRDAFRDALNTIVHQTSWTVWIDEAKYVSEMLKLRTELTYAVEQLRSINATVVSGAQRPAWLPPSVLSNATHVFLWKSTNRDDAAKLADIGGIDAREVRDQARSLGKHEFIYIKTRGTDTSILRSQVRKEA